MTNENDFIQKNLKASIDKSYAPINKEVYDKYNVKKGLRYKDGTGVMAGVTSIGEVSGYYIDDGEKKPMHGHLRYRGYDIFDIIDACEKENRFGFEEVVYLLMTGELPTKQELEDFKSFMGCSRFLPDGFAEDMIMKAPSNNIMNKLARSVLAAYSYDDNPDDLSIDNIFMQSIQLIAQLPVMASYGYQAKRHYYDGQSLILHAPNPELSTAENFLYMLRPDNKYTKDEAELLDALLMVHAEHGGGNNSAFTTHVVSSSDTDTYSAISAAIGSLKGPKHGGANAKVMGMIEDIKANVSDWTDKEAIKAYLARIIRKEVYDCSGLIYGMGHAIYTLSDPRALIIKNKAEKLASKNEELLKEFNLYKLVEELTPEVFDKVKNNGKTMCANVDLYSGFVYKMLGIPSELYTPLFAIARIPGWCAHRLEEVHANRKIIRPAYKSICKPKQYTLMCDR